MPTERTSSNAPFTEHSNLPFMSITGSPIAPSLTASFEKAPTIELFPRFGSANAYSPNWSSLSQHLHETGANLSTKNKYRRKRFRIRQVIREGKIGSVRSRSLIFQLGRLPYQLGILSGTNNQQRLEYEITPSTFLTIIINVTCLHSGSFYRFSRACVTRFCQLANWTGSENWPAWA